MMVRRRSQGSLKQERISKDLPLKLTEFHSEHLRPAVHGNAFPELWSTVRTGRRLPAISRRLVEAEGDVGMEGMTVTVAAGNSLVGFVEDGADSPRLVLPGLEDRRPVDVTFGVLPS